MSTKKEYLESLAGDDTEKMIDLGMKYYKGLLFESEEIADLVATDISRFFSRPLSANKIYFELLQKFNNGEITFEEFGNQAPELNL